MSAAITAEVKRGELMRFYVKQVESAQVDEFSHMSVEELEAFIWGALQNLMGRGGKAGVTDARLCFSRQVRPRPSPAVIVPGVAADALRPTLHRLRRLMRQPTQREEASGF